MVRLTPPEYLLLDYVSGDSPDLSRPSLAAASGVIPVSVSRILRSLQDRGLVIVTHGPNRRIQSLVPTFAVKRGVSCYIGFPRQDSTAGKAVQS